MGKPARYDPNMFEACCAPALHEAFASAWRVLTAQQDDPENEPGSVGLQRRIASAIIAAAAGGVTDPTRLANMAIERCASRRAFRLAS
jgi:hypothetical protein